MHNKMLVVVMIPSLEAEYNVFIPINRKVGTIKTYILNAIKELTDNTFNKLPTEVQFLDRDTGKPFKVDAYIKDSGIKNGSRIIII